MKHGFTLTVEDIASRWAGIEDDDSKIDLEAMQFLFDTETIAFKTDKKLRRLRNGRRRYDKCDLKVEVRAYPNSMPVAVAKAVMKLLEFRAGVTALNLAMNDCVYLGQATRIALESPGAILED